MQEVARVYLSSNGREFLIYDGTNELVAIVAVGETAKLETIVSETAETAAEIEGN